MPLDIKSLLKEATSKISSDYFQLALAGSKMEIYRERLYCYELYHQLRNIWPAGSEYQLGGEIDKQGHEIIDSNVKPDFLVHVPGSMDKNHTIIEVKPICADPGGIKKDLETLTEFRRNVAYGKAIYLIYGDDGTSRITTAIQRHSAQTANNKIDLSLIEIWWHKEVSKAAELIRAIDED